jgi:ankyrin repeat protein
MMWPVEHGTQCNSCFQVLLGAGAKLEAKDNSYRTPLLWAARGGHLDAVNTLLAAGANTEATDRKYWTAVQHAASQRHVAVIQALAVAGADLESKDGKGWTALRNACDDRSFTVVKALLAAGADMWSVGDPISTIFSLATDNGCVQTVLTLLNSGVPVHDVSVLWRAAGGEHVEVLEAVLSFAAKNGDISKFIEDHPILLREAEQSGRDKNLQLLLKLKEDSTAKDTQGSTQARVDAGARGSQSWPALHRASCTSDVDQVQALLAAGVDANARDANDRTALMLFLDWRYYDDCYDRVFLNNCILRLLLQASDLEARAGPEERTALLLAAAKGQVKSIRALVAAGADINVVDSTGLHCLHLLSMHMAEASYYLREAPQRYGSLLEDGADVVAASATHPTPLDMLLLFSTDHEWLRYPDTAAAISDVIR